MSDLERGYNQVEQSLKNCLNSQTTLQVLLVVVCLLLFYYYRKSNGIKALWFYRPSCPHCQNMEPEWRKLEIKCMMGSMTHCQKINLDDVENSGLKEEFSIKSVPTIYKVNKGKREMYTGPRTADSISAWLALPFSG